MQNEGLIIEKTDSFDFIKIKNFDSSKDIVKKVNMQSPHWEKIFASNVFDKSIRKRQPTQLQTG